MDDTSDPTRWMIDAEGVRLEHAFFISHVGEDTKDVIKLKEKIRASSKRGGRHALTCFLDTKNWLHGNENAQVIREKLLQSEYVIIWITSNFLEITRGWIWIELAYAELIEQSRNIGQMGLPYTFIVPIFRGVSHDTIERTPLLNYWQRRLKPEHTKDSHSVESIAKGLVEFYEQERTRRQGPSPSRTS